MKKVMRGLLLLIIGSIMTLIILTLSTLIQKDRWRRKRIKSPLERGFATTRKIYSVLSLQLFVILILFLILDLEVIFIISFIFGNNIRLLKRRIFLLLIIRTL